MYILCSWKNGELVGVCVRLADPYVWFAGWLANLPTRRVSLAYSVFGELGLKERPIKDT